MCKTLLYCSNCLLIGAHLNLDKLRLASISFNELGPLYFSSFDHHQVDEAYSKLSEINVRDAVVLHTCNRFEVYYIAGPSRDEFVANQITSVHGRVKIISGREVARHLFRVAAGLESMVQGEGEVLGQVRQAWESAREMGFAGPSMNKLFRAAVEAGRAVRAQTPIGKLRRSVAGESISLFRDHGGKSPVLVVGAGMMGQRLAGLLKKNGFDVSVTNRHHEKAVSLAQSLSIPSVPFSVEDWGSFRGIFIAVKGDRFLIDPSNASKLKEAEVIVDLSTPYAVDPSIASGFRLINMSMISERTRETELRRAELVEGAERFIETEFRRFVNIEENGAESAIKEMYLRSEEEMQAILMEMKKKMEAGRLNEAEMERLLSSYRGRLLSIASRTVRELEEGKREEREIESINT